MHNLKQELGIKKNVLMLVIYATHNKIRNRMIIYSRKCLYHHTLFFINGLFILWRLKAYR